MNRVKGNVPENSQTVGEKRRLLGFYLSDESSFGLGKSKECRIEKGNAGRNVQG